MKIFISSRLSLENTKFAIAIHKITGKSVSDVKSKLLDGKGGFFYSAELFLNDYSEIADDILEIIKISKEMSVGLFIVELGHDKFLENIDNSNLDQYEISVKVLQNTILTTKGNYE